MRKDNVMFVVLGLVVGLVIGFIGANSLNRSAYDKQPASTASNSDPNGNPALPPNHPPLGGSGSNSSQSGPRPEVMAAIEMAKAQPQDHEAQMTAGDLYYQIKRFEDAARFYEAASKLRPTDKEALVKAGDAYFDAAATDRENDNQQAANPKFAMAEKWYTRALAQDPKDVSVRTDLGLTFFLREPPDVDKAIKEYNTTLSMRPDHEKSLQNLVLAYDQNGDKANFQSTMEKLMKVNPDNPIIKKFGNK